MTGFINTFCYNLSWSQSITRTHNQSSAKPFFLDCRGLAPFSFSFYDDCQLLNSTLLYPLCIVPQKNTLYCWQSLFTVPLPSNRSPIVPRVCFCGNVFRDPFTSNGHGVDHIENNSFNSFFIAACTYFGRCLEMGLQVTIYVFKN
jgi:hypothetical protein